MSIIDIINTWLPMVTFAVSIGGIIWKSVISIKTMVDKLAAGIETLNNTIKVIIVDIKETKEDVKFHSKEINDIKVDIAEIKATLKESRK